jgi:hypothetical protein
MKKIGRFSLADVSMNRVAFALRNRVAEIPHTITWNFKHFGQVNRERIRQFQGIHTGKRCFIVANGPSLKNTNLDILANEYTFGLNRVYLSFPDTIFRPTYYLAVNELILEQFSSDIAKLEMPKFLNWNRRSSYDLSSSSIYYLKAKMVINDSFETDLTRAIVFGGTVTFVALQLAYYMGFEKVILIGLDHNYSDKGVPSETVIRKDSIDQSHFHPDYFPKGYKWQLPDLMRSEIDYRLALSHFQQDGRQILDATLGGQCQVFEKVEYLSLFTTPYIK